MSLGSAHSIFWVTEKRSMRMLGDKITDDYKSLRLGSTYMHLTLYTDYGLHCYRCKCRQITHHQNLTKLSQRGNSYQNPKQNYQ